MKRSTHFLLAAWLGLGCLLGCAAPAALSEPTPAPVAPSATPQPTLTPRPTSTALPTPTVTPQPTATLQPQPVRVVRSYPFDGDQAVGESRALVLAFDRPVEAALAETRLVISPTTSGQISWPGPTRLVFTPDAPWSTQQWFEVTLEPGPLAADGGALEEGWGARFRHGGRGTPLPVLMYHHVKELGADATEGQLAWTVSPEALAAQIAHLVAEGWQTISPGELADYFEAGEPLPAKPLLITFDDGYKEVYEHAYPLFMSTTLRPTLFIITQDTDRGYPAMMDWGQLQELVAKGFHIGSHSSDHSDLRKKDSATLAYQIGDSQALLEERLGVRVDAFCYPYGSGAWEDAVLEMLRHDGYRSGYTLNPTYWQDPENPLQLGRLRVSYEMTVEDLAALLP